MTIVEISDSLEWGARHQQRTRLHAISKIEPWSAQEDESLVRMYVSGELTQPEIAAILCRTYYAVRNRLHGLRKAGRL
jgi:hypothetical protein